jgi:glycosyltransferase involved in cell wall biosynthesis
MKILHVIDSGGLYGAEIMLLNLVQEQLLAGLSPMILSLGSWKEQAKPFEIEARKRLLPLTIMRFNNGPNFFGGLKVIRLALDQSYQIFHSHGYKGNILLGLFPLSVRKLPIVSTLHGWTSTKWLSRMRIYELLDSFSLRLIDRVVLVNSAMLQHPRLSSNRKKIAVVENGIPDSFDLPPQSSDEDIVSFCSGGQTFCAIGRLSKEKGFDVLLRAVKCAVGENPDIRLLLIGEGREREALATLTADLGMSRNVMLAGYRDSAFQYLRFCKGLVISSFTEGLPIVLLEAIREGAHVIATSVGGIPDVLARTGGGVLVPVGDIAALAHEILDSCDERLASSEEIGRIIEHFKEHYTSSVMERRYNEIYTSILQGG